MNIHAQWQQVKCLICSRQVIYEVTVVTGDVQNAGTDTQIFMSVFGSNGSTEEMLLQKNEDRYPNMEEDDVKKQREIKRPSHGAVVCRQVRARSGGHFQHGDRRHCSTEENEASYRWLRQ